MLGHVDANNGYKPLLRGRGAIRIEDFCRSTGLDVHTVENLMRSGRLEGVLWTAAEPSHPVAIFDDLLPSREALVALGLPVSEDYEPEDLRSYESADEDYEPEDLPSNESADDGGDHDVIRGC